MRRLVFQGKRESDGRRWKRRSAKWAASQSWPIEDGREGDSQGFGEARCAHGNGNGNGQEDQDRELIRRAQRDL